MQKLKIGVVGLHYGKHVIENELLQGPGAEWFELAAVCSKEPEVTQALAQRYNVKAYHDIESLLRDDQIPCVCLLTGPENRAELIRKIMRAGKDVITTKPFGTDAQAALDVLCEARKCSRVVHVNSPNPELSADLQCMSEWRDKLNLGRPIFAQSATWASYREAADNTWYDDPLACPAAPIARLGIYNINDVTYFLGEPRDVKVTSSHIFTSRPTPDNAQIMIEFQGGALASVLATFCVNDGHWYPDSLVIGFENGVIYRNMGIKADGQKYMHLAVQTGNEWKPSICTADIELSQKSGAYMWKAFYKSVRENTVPSEAYIRHISHGVMVLQALRNLENTKNRQKHIQQCGNLIPVQFNTSERFSGIKV